MRRAALILIGCLIFLAPLNKAEALSRYKAQHYRYANSLWCPQHWRTAYGAKRLIRCEAELYGVNVDEALKVAYRESRYHWWASNSCCHGLFQQHEDYWSSRFAAYAPRHFHYGIFGGRTNAVVSVRMARAEGWDAWTTA